MTQEEIKKHLSTADDLPAMPQIWVQVKKATDELNASARDIAKIILKDQGLTSRLLRISNSAVYAGYHQKITTVTNAIVLLGFKEVRSTVLGYSVYQLLRKMHNNKVFDFKAFWIHSLTTGVAAKMLAERIQYDLPEEAFVAGLLHDSGKLIANQLFPKEYSVVLQHVAQGKDWLQAEKAILGADHQMLGSWVAEKWHFPPVLIKALARHHRTGLRKGQRSSERLVDIVAVANQMAKIIFRNSGTDVRSSMSQCQNMARLLLHLSPEKWTHVLKSLASNVRAIVEEYQMDRKDVDAYLREEEHEQAGEQDKDEMYRKVNRELTEKVQELTALNEFTTALLQNREPGDILPMMLEHIRRGINFSRIILFQQQDEHSLHPTLAFGPDCETLQQNGSTIALNTKGALATAFKQGRCVNIIDASHSMYAEQVSQDELNLLDCPAFACVPVLAGQKALAVISVDNHIAGEPVSDQKVNAVMSFANQAGLVLEKSESFVRV